jgi:hypothetical protein
MSESIPSVLQYGANQSNFRVNEFACRPQEGEQKSGGRYTVKLPSKSIVNLSSLRAFFDISITGLSNAGAADYSNAMVPASYQVFRSIQFRVGGSTVSGGLLSHYNQVYHAMLRASANVEWTRSRFNENYQVLSSLINDDFNETTSQTSLKAQPGVTSKSARLCHSDLLGLPHANGGECYIDTSLFGDVEVIFDLDNTSCLSVARAGTTATSALSLINFTLSNFVVNVKCITSISPLYVELLAMKLQSKTPIRFPFENIVSTLQQNGTAGRLSINTSCLDKFLIAAHNADPTVVAAVAADTLNNNKFKFDSGRTKANAGDTRMQIRIGSELYPKNQIQNAHDLASYTDDALHGINASSTNMLYVGYDDTANAVVYQKAKFLSENCMLVQKYCLQEGWAGSKTLTGISSNGNQLDIEANYANFGSYQLLAAFITSQLVYQDGQVSVEA